MDSPKTPYLSRPIEGGSREIRIDVNLHVVNQTELFTGISFGIEIGGFSLSYHRYQISPEPIQKSFTDTYTPSDRCLFWGYSNSG